MLPHPVPARHPRRRPPPRHCRRDRGSRWAGPRPPPEARRIPHSRARLPRRCAHDLHRHRDRPERSGCRHPRASGGYHRRRLSRGRGHPARHHGPARPWAHDRRLHLDRGGARDGLGAGHWRTALVASALTLLVLVAGHRIEQLLAAPFHEAEPERWSSPPIRGPDRSPRGAGGLGGRECPEHARPYRSTSIAPSRVPAPASAP